VTLRALLASAALVPLALFTAPAHAVLPPGNIVPNGDAEAGPGAMNATETQAPPSWNALPNFTAVSYSAGGGFPTAAEAPTIGGGSNFFAGGPQSGFGDSIFASQEIGFSEAAPEVDAGNVQAILTADVGGYQDQEDNTTVYASFSTADRAATTGMSVGPVSAAQRGGRTGFLERVACTTLPRGTRILGILIAADRTAGEYNDGYADNISVRLTNDPCPAVPAEPLPPPVEAPIPQVNANAAVARGRVFVKRPGSSDFQELSDARSIPIGSEVDATRGAVNLETATNATGGSQTGQFYQGSFVVTQTAGSRPTTDLTMTGRIDKCAGTRKDDVRTAARARRLWGNARGRFRTRGRHASAAVRGTLWSVRDTCNATRVSVRRGSVLVRDFSKRRNIRLKAPKSYTARARSRR
jgi:hypothetical protein